MSLARGSRVPRAVPERDGAGGGGEGTGVSPGCPRGVPGVSLECPWSVPGVPVLGRVPAFSPSGANPGGSPASGMSQFGVYRFRGGSQLWGGWRCPKLPWTLLSPPEPPTQGQATDIAIQAEEILKLKRQINGLYAKHTGQPLPVIEAAMERDRYLSPVEAQEFGLLDQVLVHPPPRGEDEPRLVQKETPNSPSGPPQVPPAS
uniref:Caseinolytic mitochondrial matrix peptidase proteolytic subunit n=1 Tax=Cyanoderma ruficeps TaxID=181631 RepID=A0A8C3QSV5_9PASS